MTAGSRFATRMSRIGPDTQGQTETPVHGTTRGRLLARSEPASLASAASTLGAPTRRGNVRASPPCDAWGLGSSPMQQAPSGPAALDNRPLHRSLRYRRGPATSGAASLNGPVRRDRQQSAHSRVRGAVAQLGERCNRTAEVRGSTPLSSIAIRSSSAKIARHASRQTECCPPPLGRT